jgi:hypothetical protein
MMTETKKRTRKEQSAEDLDQQIAGMEAELEEGYGKPLTWDEVTSTTAEEIARKEQRRSVLPRPIHAARVKRLEREAGRREEEALELQEKVETTHAAFREREEEMRGVKERCDAAQAEWALALSASQSANDRARRAARELRKLRESGR